MFWFRLIPTAHRDAVNAAADMTDRRVNALQSHQGRVLEALDRELELYRLDATNRNPHP